MATLTMTNFYFECDILLLIFRCEGCGISFSCKTALRKHSKYHCEATINKVHLKRRVTHTRKTDKWRCLMCRNMFSRDKLEKHIWICTVKLPCLNRIDETELENRNDILYGKSPVLHLGMKKE